PVVRDPGASVETRLVLAIRAVRALRDLDDQHGVSGMRLAVGARVARHHGDIGLRLRVGAERERQLRADLPTVAERPPELPPPPADRGGVRNSLWLAED